MTVQKWIEQLPRVVIKTVGSFSNGSKADYQSKNSALMSWGSLQLDSEQGTHEARDENNQKGKKLSKAFGNLKNK